jgi:hypothetical protein
MTSPPLPRKAGRSTFSVTPESGKRNANQPKIPELKFTISVVFLTGLQHAQDSRKVSGEDGRTGRDHTAAPEEKLYEPRADHDRLLLG